MGEKHVDSVNVGSLQCNARQRTATHCNTLQHSAARCNTLQHSEEDSVREACPFCECWASHTRSSFVVWYLYMFRVEGFRFTILALPNAQSYRLTTKCAKLPSPCAKLLSSDQSFWTFLNEQSADIHRNDVSGVGFWDSKVCTSIFAKLLSLTFSVSHAQTSL